mmetsp:Transcript_68805/g.136126  ORF Transcript_68805/g.136126 Transcript_68805/m.136126 type:complete len:458 (+) Transcript_68805:64-1437(+)
MAGPRQRSLTNHRKLSSLLLAGKTFVALGNPPACPGTIDIGGFGLAAVVPTGWKSPEGSPSVHAYGGSQVMPQINSRAYLASGCSSGSYNPADYLAFNLLGKTMRYTTDLSGSTCGCNAALSLTSMHYSTSPGECSDYYCDANRVCGQSCAEIDLQEANQFAWHSTLHTKNDHTGLGGGYGGGGQGWNGPRTWMAHQYGPYRDCIDTTMPFDVAVSFPADASCQLTSLQVVLSQTGRSCPLAMEIKGYHGMAELSEALRRGMTPTVSYWGSEDLGWMDGLGADQKGPCSFDAPKACAAAVRFYNFSIHDIEGTPCVQKLTNQPPASRSSVRLDSTVTAVPPSEDVEQTEQSEDDKQGSDLQEAGSDQAAGYLSFSTVSTAAGGFIVGAIAMCAVLLVVPSMRQSGGPEPPVGPCNAAVGFVPSTKVEPAGDKDGDLKRTLPSSTGLLAMGASADPPI